MALPQVTPEMLLVFGLIGAALVLFVTELVPSDITAIAVLVSLVLEPWTQVGAQDAISGFASPAGVRSPRCTSSARGSSGPAGPSSSRASWSRARTCSRSSPFWGCSTF